MLPLNNFFKAMVAYFSTSCDKREWPSEIRASYFFIFQMLMHCPICWQTIFSCQITACKYGFSQTTTFLFRQRRFVSLVALQICKTLNVNCKNHKIHWMRRKPKQDHKIKENSRLRIERMRKIPFTLKKRDYLFCNFQFEGNWKAAKLLD